MSSAELGASLLQRQQEQTERSYNRSKKMNKIDKTLALVLAGQSIFTGAYRNREKELRDAETWEARENVAQAKQINNMSVLGMPITPEFLRANQGLSPAEQAEKLLSNPRTRAIYTENLSPVLNRNLELAHGEEGFAAMRPTAAYNKQLASAIQTVATELLTPGENGVIKIQNFMDELPTLFKTRDFDRLELLERGVSLTPVQLTELEAESYKQMRKQYRAQGSLVGGIKGVFRRLSGKAEADGTINVFKALEDLDLSHPELSKVLDTIDLKGFVTRSATETRVDAAAAPRNYYLEAQLSENEELRASMALTVESLQPKKVVDGTPVAEMLRDTDIIPEDIEDFVTYLQKEDNNAQAQQYYTDVTALTIRLRKDPAYARKLYDGFGGSDQEVDKFTEEIKNNPVFTQTFAAVYVARKGFKNRRFGKDSYTSDQTLANVSYTYESLSVETGQISIVMDNDTGAFTPTEDYRKAPEETRQRVWDAGAKGIVDNVRDNNLGTAVLQAVLTRYSDDTGGSPDGADQTDAMQRILRDGVPPSRDGVSESEAENVTEDGLAAEMQNALQQTEEEKWNTLATELYGIPDYLDLTTNELETIKNPTERIKALGQQIAKRYRENHLLIKYDLTPDPEKPGQTDSILGRLFQLPDNLTTREVTAFKKAADNTPYKVASRWWRSQEPTVILSNPDSIAAWLYDNPTLLSEFEKAGNDPVKFMYAITGTTMPKEALDILSRPLWGESWWEKKKPAISETIDADRKAVRDDIGAVKKMTESVSAMMSGASSAIKGSVARVLNEDIGGLLNKLEGAFDYDVSGLSESFSNQVKELADKGSEGFVKNMSALKIDFVDTLSNWADDNNLNMQSAVELIDIDWLYEVAGVRNKKDES
jgi:hypothetical protein